jgi:hypothetical protein
MPGLAGVRQGLTRLYMNWHGYHGPDHFLDTGYNGPS